MSRPTFKPTDEQRRTVKTLSAYQVNEEGIARVLRITPKTLRKHFREELDRGPIEAVARVGQTDYELAKSGKHPISTINFLNKRPRWHVQNTEAAPAATPDFIVVFLKPPQWTVFRSDQRFRVVVAGRRFGKRYLALVELCRAAWGPGRLVWYVAPTYKQAKRIAWKPFKQMTRPCWASIANETDLRIELRSGGTICLLGAGVDFLDEYASIAHEALTEVLRAALADKQGRVLFIGTPRGHNHFYDLHESAESQPHWAAFISTAKGGNVLAEELELATQELDERTYRQEFEATIPTPLPISTSIQRYATVLTQHPCI
jgi:hypothetical protein